MAHILNYAPGCAGLGEPGRGTAVLGEVSRSFAPALYSIITNPSHIILRHGKARSGLARHGAVWHGKGTGLQNPVHYA